MMAINVGQAENAARRACLFMGHPPDEMVQGYDHTIGAVTRMPRWVMMRELIRAHAACEIALQEQMELAKQGITQVRVP